jgi:hypothetical protein
MKNQYSLLIPGGLLMGCGIGFLVHEIVAGTLIGIGAGIVLFALAVGVERK